MLVSLLTATIMCLLFWIILSKKGNNLLVKFYKKENGATDPANCDICFLLPVFQLYKAYISSKFYSSKVCTILYFSLGLYLRDRHSVLCVNSQSAYAVSRIVANYITFGSFWTRNRSSIKICYLYLTLQCWDFATDFPMFKFITFNY